MALEVGSEEYWDLKEHAERLYRKSSDARSASERREIAEQGNEFADRMEEKYGFDNDAVRYLIKEYYLRRLD
jgi:hypothetical protein